jgi:glyoxylase-like metal-dependent hydrolase (beta-lactamase superfamily II)
MLDDGIREMQQLIDRYQADGEAFLDGQPKRLLPELYYLGDYHDRAVYAFCIESKLFVVDAPGGPGLVDFIPARLRQLGVGPVEPTAVLLTACGQRETAGLEEFVRRSHARVVCSPDGIAGIRQLCGPDSVVLSSDELPIAGWFPVTTIRLGGRGVSPVAYVLRWAGKNVLLAGSIPADIDQNEPVELSADLAANSIATTEAYIESLERLAKARPDLWLPAVPLNGRNANVYGQSWAEMLEKNRRVAAYALRFR